jgi:hypothetical protein
MSTTDSNTVDIPPASKLFNSITTQGGNYVLECRCGRTNFASHRSGELGDLHEIDEYAEYAEKAASDPDHYVEHAGCDGVCMSVFGFVIGCSCNGQGRYEAFIWEYRGVIAKYIVARTKDEMDGLTQNAILRLRENS